MSMKRLKEVEPIIWVQVDVKNILECPEMGILFCKKKLTMKVLITFILIIIGTFGFSQTYDVTYQRTRKKIYNKGLSPEMLKTLNIAISKTIRVFHLLHFNGKSKFFLDHALFDGELDDDPRKMTGFFETYKDFSEGNCVHVGDVVGKNTAVRERFDEIFNWQIEYDRDTTIFGLTCHRATTLYNEDPVVAWFSNSIPIMDGPSRYAGLPGLILRVEMTDELVEVSDILIIENTAKEIIIPVRERYISFKEFKEESRVTVKAKRIKKN